MKMLAVSAAVIGWSIKGVAVVKQGLRARISLIKCILHI